jgi:GTP cyclohydrolase II
MLTKWRGGNSPPCYNRCFYGDQAFEQRAWSTEARRSANGCARGTSDAVWTIPAVALVRGDIQGRAAPLVRVHSQCLTGDVLASLRCDCRAQLELSLKKIGKAPAGILLYLPQEGRGIGLMNKLRAYELQDGGMDTVEANVSLGFAADAREYDFPAKILKELGATRIRLLSNNPDKVKQLESAGVKVVQRVPCQPRISKISRGYLQTKKSKMGHLLEGV